MNKYTVAVAAAGALALTGVFASTAEARIQIDPSTCGNKDAMVERLVTRFGESLQNQRQHILGLIETFANEEKGTWTDLITNPQNSNLACIFAAGREFESKGGIIPEYAPQEAPEHDIEEPKFDL